MTSRFSTAKTILQASAAIAILLLLVFAAGQTIQPVRASGEVVLSAIQCDGSVTTVPNHGSTFNSRVILTNRTSASVTIAITSDHPEIAYPDTDGAGSVSIGAGKIAADFQIPVALPDQDTYVTLTATLDGHVATCRMKAAGTGPSLTPTAVPGAPVDLDSIGECQSETEFDYNGGAWYFWVTVYLSGAAPADVKVALSSDHPDLLWSDTDGKDVLSMIEGDDSTVEAGTFNLPLHPTTVVVTAKYHSQTATCTLYLPGGVQPTPVPTATPIPYALVSVHAQVSSRSGHLTKITVCLNRSVSSGTKSVGLSSDNPGLIPVPATVTVQRFKTCGSTDVPVAHTTHRVTVQFTATMGSVSKTTSTLVRPFYPSLTTQTVSRANGLARVTVCNTSYGRTVNLTSSDPTLFPLPASVTIAPHHGCAPIIVTVGDTAVPEDVTITASFNTGDLTSQTIVRRIGSGPFPTATETVIATDTATAVPTDTETAVPTETATEVATDTATPEPTLTDTEVPTETTTPEPTATDTDTPTLTPEM
jgi:hypothetical protein